MRRVEYTFVSETGLKFDVQLTDFIIVDDIVNTSARMEGFRRRTGKDVYDDVPPRRARDYLIKLGLVFA